MSLYSDHVNSLTPLAYWRLGDAIGSTIAVDEIDTYNGTYVNTPTLESTSLVVDDLDTSATFNGVNQYGYVLNQAFNISTYSVSAIIQVSTYPNSSRTITKVSNAIDSTTQDKTLFIDSTGHISFYTFDGAGKYSLSPNPIPLNEPIHIVATIGATTNSLYINGKLVDTIASSGSYASFATANQFIGGHGANSILYFDGIVDEVCVFNTELTLDNAKDLYVYGLALSVPTNYEEKVKSLVPMSYHRFAESSGLVAIDDIGDHVGAYNIAPTFQQTGALLDDSLDPCILLDTESMSIADHAEYNISNSFTISLFVKTLGAITGTYDVLWMKGNSGSWTTGCGLIRTTDGGVNVVRFWVGNWQTQTVQFLDSLITDGQWHNIVVSYNSTTDLISLYLDSILQDTSTTAVLNISSVIYTFKDPALSSQFNGYYDELIYFNEDLTQTEIADLYTYATTVYVPPESVPLGELIGLTGSYNEWTKLQSINFILRDPKVMFAVRSRYKETLTDKIQTRLFIRPSLPNDYISSISGTTYVRNVPTKCIVYVYTKDMNLVDVFLSNEDGTYETSSVDLSNDYHIVAKSLTDECPGISGKISPI